MVGVRIKQRFEAALWDPGLLWETRGFPIGQGREAFDTELVAASPWRSPKGQNISCRNSKSASHMEDDG
ncbi:hypothetical protein BDW68DRAFT_163616 [Aspergillus falconensis]